MKNPVDIFLKMERSSRDRLIAVVASVLLHIFLLIAVTAFSGDSLDVKLMPTAIDVDLMYVKAAPLKKKTTIKTTVKKKRQKVRKKAVKKKKKAVSLNRKKNVKKKIKVVKSQDIINDAISRLKKDLENQEENVIADRLESLQKEALENNDELDDIVDAETPVQSEGRGGLLVSQYCAYARVAVQENWAFSKNLAGGIRNLETRIRIKVWADGKIIATDIVKKSGNAYMDSTASMAVKRSSPLRAFPEGLKRKYIEIELGFGPK